MFERYCEAARRTLFYARYEISLIGGPAIETEHLLLGLLRETAGLTRSIFSTAKLSYDNARAEIESAGSNRQKVATSVEIPFSADAARALQYAMEEADSLQHKDIGTEHLLLGILRVGDAVATPLLWRYGLTLDGTRDQIRQLLADGLEPSWKAQRTHVMNPRDQIDAMKLQLRQFEPLANAGAENLIARIVQELEDLKQFFN